MILDHKQIKMVNDLLSEIVKEKHLNLVDLKSNRNYQDIELFKKIIAMLDVPVKFESSKVNFTGSSVFSAVIDDIKHNLGNISEKVEISLFQLLGSTNDQAFKESLDHDTKYSFVISESQLSGRGRQGKSWISPYGANIYCSLGFQVDHIEEIRALPLKVAVVINRVLVDSGVCGAQVKWPNDIVFNKKKLAGILVETKVRGSATQVVIGLGLNVFRHEKVIASVGQPVAFLNDVIADNQIDKNRLIAMIVRRIVEMLDKPKDITEYLNEWSELDLLLGKSVEIAHENAFVSGTALGINEEGDYLVEVAGETKIINSSYVSLRPGA